MNFKRAKAKAINGTLSHPEGKKTIPGQKQKKRKFQSKREGEALDKENAELLVLTKSWDKREDLCSTPLYNCC